MLFVPGHKREWMLKAPRFGADALIFDLEDSVPFDSKGQARSAVCDALRALADADVGRFVRVNGLGDGLTLDDLVAVVAENLDGVVLPKVRSPRDVVVVDALLDELERSRGLSPGAIEIVPLPESASALREYYDVCVASARIRRAPVSSGHTPGGDVHRAMGTEASDDGLESLYIASKAVLDARAAGIEQILGGMVTRIDDPDLVRHIATRARMRGATGTMVIHPSHVAVVNEVFAPTSAQLTRAAGIVSAMAAAIAAGDAATRYDGELIDIAHARTSAGLLQRARAMGLEVPPHADLDLR